MREAPAWMHDHEVGGERAVPEPVACMHDQAAVAGALSRLEVLK